MNKVTLMGNLTREPELNQISDEKCVCTFTVAHNNGKDKEGNERPSDFITCKAWNRKAEAISKYLHKGDKILVMGAFKTDKYTDKTHEDVTHYSSYVLVDEFEFAGSKSSGNNNTTTNNAEPEVSSDDIPF